MRRPVFNEEHGFTLIEILIVLAMFGVVMGVLYSLYVTHQRSAYTQDEVADVQQNLRIATDSITRDIQMAGFLIPFVDDAGTAENMTDPLLQPPRPKRDDSNEKTGRGPQ